MKHCKFCQQEKSLEDFPRNAAMKDGRDNRCKACWKVYSAEKRARGKTWKANDAGNKIVSKPLMEPAVEPDKPQAGVDYVVLGRLSQLPGDRKFFEYTGSSSSGLRRYRELYGKSATIVYTFRNTRHFIGQA